MERMTWDNWPFWWLPPDDTDLAAEADRLGFERIAFVEYIEKQRRKIDRAAWEASYERFQGNPTAEPQDRAPVRRRVRNHL